jgi:hypothetical protein
MLMPKASMDEDYSFILWQHNVRTTGQIAPMQAKPEAVEVQQRSDKPLWSGILALDA